MTFTYRYRKQILIGVLLFLGILGISIFTYYQLKDKKPKNTISILKKKEEKEEEKEEKVGNVTMYTVDIKGQVAQPGIYSMEKESRIIDVIEKAGGLTENANTSVINLSKKVQDEMVIIIYSQQEVEHFEQTKALEQQVQEYCVLPSENALKNDACITEGDKTVGKISINTATLEELMTLKGIGEAKARDIIAYREKNGPFQTIEEIKNVSGIGESRFAAIQEDITV